MTPQEARIGLRACFIGIDHTFHSGERMGKVGTIVADAAFNAWPDAANWGEGCCGWQADGQEGIYITGLEDLTAVN